MKCLLCLHGVISQAVCREVDVTAASYSSMHFFSCRRITTPKIFWPCQKIGLLACPTSQWIYSAASPPSPSLNCTVLHWRFSLWVHIMFFIDWTLPENPRGLTGNSNNPEVFLNCECPFIFKAESPNCIISFGYSVEGFRPFFRFITLSMCFLGKLSLFDPMALITEAKSGGK